MRLSHLKTEENAHEDSIWTVAWSAGLDTIVTGSVDETVKFWKGKELQAVQTFTGHALGVVSVALDPSSNLVASSSLDSVIRVWDLGTNEQKAVFEATPSESWSVAFSPDGRHVAAAGGSSLSVAIWSIETRQKEATYAVPPPDPPGMAAAAAAAGSKSSSAAAVPPVQQRFLLSVCYSPDGRYLACGAMDGCVCVFDVAGGGKLLHSLKGHFLPVRSLTFTPDSRMLVTACDDMHSHLYDAASGELISVLSGHHSWVLAVAASPDGTCLATGSSDKTVKLWELSSRSCVQTVADHTDQVWSVAFRPSGGGGSGAMGLVSVSDDRSIAVYDCT
eukprot:jgi/Mesvir1/17994/Mv09336-RA.1